MGFPFTTVRTGATVAVGVRHLSRADASHVGLLGTGRIALDFLRAVLCVREVTEIHVFSRNEENRREFCQRASEALAMPVRPVNTAREVFSGSDVVLTATNSKVPAFDPSWVEPGTHVGSMGPESELHADMFARADHVVVGVLKPGGHSSLRSPRPISVGRGRKGWQDQVGRGA